MNNICERCAHRFISHAETTGLDSFVATLAHIGLDLADSTGKGRCSSCGETAELVATATNEEIEACTKLS